MRERGKGEGGRERKRERGRGRGREGEGREGERGRERKREGGREGGRERVCVSLATTCSSTAVSLTMKFVCLFSSTLSLAVIKCVVTEFALACCMCVVSGCLLWLALFP